MFEGIFLARSEDEHHHPPGATQPPPKNKGTTTRCTVGAVLDVVVQK